MLISRETARMKNINHFYSCRFGRDSEDRCISVEIIRYNLIPLIWQIIEQINKKPYPSLSDINELKDKHWRQLQKNSDYWNDYGACCSNPPPGFDILLIVDMSSNPNWKEVFSFINNLNDIPGEWANAIINEIKLKRYLSRHKVWEETLPHKIVEWAYDVIRNEAGEFHTESERAGDVSKRLHKKRYNKIKKDASSLSFDTIRTGPDGRRYAIGFNYCGG